MANETRATMRARVQSIVGTAINTTINQGLLDGCKKLQEMHNWRFMEASTTLTVADGDTTFSLPSDFKSELNPEMADSSAAGYRRATKLIKNAIESRDVTETGQPLSYRTWEGVGIFGVASDGGYSFPIEYYRYFADLDDDDSKSSDANFQAFLNKCHEAIEFYAISRCYRRLQNLQLAKEYQNEVTPLGQFELKALALIKEDEDIELANTALVMDYPG